MGCATGFPVEGTGAQQLEASTPVRQAMEAVRKGVGRIRSATRSRPKRATPSGRAVRPSSMRRRGWRTRSRSSIAHTRSHEASAAEMSEAASGLEREAEALRRAVCRFRT
jgi:hypothetical protein